MLTPTPRTPLDRTRETLALWTALGCRVVEMSPVEHDEILAYTSHLPHAVAAALAASVPAEWLPLAAGAYRDGTRVAAADTELWAAIFRENRGPMLKALDTLQECLDAFKYALMTDDEDAIRTLVGTGPSAPRPLRRRVRPRGDRSAAYVLNRSLLFLVKFYI